MKNRVGKFNSLMVRLNVLYERILLYTGVLICLLKSIRSILNDSQFCCFFFCCCLVFMGQTLEPVQIDSLQRSPYGLRKLIEISEQKTIS